MNEPRKQAHRLPVPPPFLTTDLKTAGLALAAGGHFVKVHDDDPRQITFEIAGVDERFDQLLHAGKITVDAGRAWQCLEQVHKLLLASKRRTAR